MLTRARARSWFCCTGFRSAGRCGRSSFPGIGSIYRVIAPDLRGHGESPAPEGVYTMDEMADDVVELLETLAYQRAGRAGWAVDGGIRGALAGGALSRRESGP